MKKIALVVGILLVIAGGVAGWFWRQATALPDWYEPQAIAELDAAELEAHEGPGAGLHWTVVPDREAEPAREDPRPAAAPTKRPRKAVMKNFHLRTHVQNPEVRKAFRASRATYEDEHLEAGVVMNLSRIPRESLGQKDKSFFERVAKAFPSVAKRDVYVAIEDEPRVGDDGILQLGPDPRVRVGNLTYSLRTVAKRLRMSEREVRRDINRELRRMKVRDPAFNPALSPAP